MVADKELTRQTMKTVIGTNKNEWFLNPDEGINFKNILGKNPDYDVIKGEVTDGIKQVDKDFILKSFSYSLDENRNLKISFEATNGTEVIGNTIVIDNSEQKPKKYNVVQKVSGASLYNLSNTANYPLLSVRAYGKSEQQQYSGKNLFDFNAWRDSISSVTNGTAVYDKNSFKLTATSNDCFVFGTEIIVKPKTTYTLSWNANNNKNGTNVVYVYGMAVDVVTADNATAKSITFTTKPDSTDIRVVFGVQNAGESITYSNIQLEVGETATSYEPYVGGVSAPNPNYPQEIKSVGDNGSIETTAYGKNLFIWNDYTTAPIFKTGVTPVGSFTITPSELQIVTDPTINKVGLYISSDKINEILSDYNGQLITLSCEMKANTEISINFGFDSSSEIVSVTTDWNKYNHIIDYNSRLTTNHLRWFANCQPKTTYYIRNIQIELGDTSTKYEPYRSKTATISTALPLCGIPVTSGGNYTDSKGQQWICDELVYDRIDGVGKIIKRTAEIIFNGSEYWKLSGNGISAFLILSNDIKAKHKTNWDKAYLFSNKYVAGSYNDYYIAKKTCISTAENGALVLYDERFRSNINGLKADMAAYNLIVVYALDTPQEVPLKAAEVEQLKALCGFEENTVVSNNADAEMTIEYEEVRYTEV